MINQTKLKPWNLYLDDKGNIKEELFKHDLFVHFGVENNLKREAAYRLAYEYGHSGSLSEIYNYFIDLVDLIK